MTVWTAALDGRGGAALALVTRLLGRAPRTPSATALVPAVIGGAAGAAAQQAAPPVRCFETPRAHETAARWATRDSRLTPFSSERMPKRRHAAGERRTAS